VLLEALFGNLRNKSKALASREVASVSHNDEEVMVTCNDGSIYRADILVGADGVYGKTRQTLWELAEPENPALVAAEKQRKFYHPCMRVTRSD
jgi:2-polyprenyl-6-methoxyphenol hydroxylase-like FAD-dependent oxidoreductase